jgi:hypothetical protein
VEIASRKPLAMTEGLGSYVVGQICKFVLQLSNISSDNKQGESHLSPCLFYIVRREILRAGSTFAREQKC